MIILIPAYEPTVKLIGLIKQLMAKDNSVVLIVDDGSGLSYQPIFNQAEDLGAIVLSHKSNLGKGAALKTGFKYLLDLEVRETIVCADSDGQHRVSDIIRIGQAIVKDQMMVLGVRGFTGKVPLKSRVGNTISSKLFGMVAGYKLKDTQTGLRAYSASLLPWLLTVEGNRFEYELNLLLEAKERTEDIVSLPIETVYEGSNEGTHFRPLVDSFLVMLPLLKFIFSSFSAGILDFLLLFLFQGITGSLFISVILARIISSIYNYTVNNFIVFKDNNETRKRSALKYFSLVIFILGLNYVIIYTLVNSLFLSTFAAKLIAEAILFIVSYTVQKLFVFYRVEHKSSQFT